MQWHRKQWKVDDGWIEDYGNKEWQEDPDANKLIYKYVLIGYRCNIFDNIPAYSFFRPLFQ